MNDFEGEVPRFEAIERPSVPAMDSRLGVPEYVLDHGFVRLIDYMGDEAAIVQAARVSYGKGTEAVSKDRGLLRYLMRHWHTTPFEMCEIKLHVKLPVFVARQWIRHRTASVNEYSARYSIMRSEFHLPSPDELAQQSTTNKQGREGSYDADDCKVIRRGMARAYDSAYTTYADLIDEDDLNLARETAREVLPMSIYTEWYWKVNAHNLLHFLRLRADPHAQKEIRAYADVICRIVEEWMPNVWEAFVDYRMGAHTFSRQEMESLRTYLRELYEYADEVGPVSIPPSLCIDGVSDRERVAFHEALGNFNG